MNIIDFYDFQINLLEAFPDEAGKNEKERILPYMPGPLEDVNEDITGERQVDLDQYCKDLLNLPSYLSQSELVQKQLFGIHEGDIELDYDPRAENSMLRQSTISTLPSTHTNSLPVQPSLQQIKIKIIHKDDMFAMKVPADCSLDYLKSKVLERVGLSVSLKYKNEASGENEPLEGELDMEEAFVQAIQRGKLTVTALANE